MTTWDERWAEKKKPTELLMKRLAYLLRLEEKEMWELEELLDAYVDARMNERLDQEFNRGDYWRDD